MEWSGGVDYWTGELEGCGQPFTAHAHTDRPPCSLHLVLHFLCSLHHGRSSEADNSCSSTSVRMPSHPPPLIHYTPQSPSSVSEPFVLCFVTGKISVCYGCRQKYPRPCQPPDDLCVRHKEWREFFPPGAGTAQTRFGNVYYHCDTPCIQARCPAFSPEFLQIPAFIAAQLLPVHTEYLASRMERTT